MLEEMDAGQFVEWLAFDDLMDEEDKRDALASRAISGVKNHKRRGR